MRKRYKALVLFVLSLVSSGTVIGQSMHFSQYYNAPMLLNPANTGLMSENDYRVGLNYRNQWAQLPVPFNTTCAFGDIKIGSGRGVEHPNWLGVGGSVFSDKAGAGSLALMQFQGSIAYHLHLSKHSMLSFGGSGAYVQRSVDYDKLSFDAQWDGYNFDSHIPNKENVGLLKTNYSTVAAGANLAFFPNEAVYIKIGAGAANLNQPVESFYNSNNQVGIRPTGNLDVLVKTSSDLIINPSVYFTTQKGAAELVAGSLTRINMVGGHDASASELLLGLYYRLNDAVIGVAGYQFGGVQIMLNYDMTISTLAPYNGSYGAMEISIIYGSPFQKNKGTKMYSCPRF